MLRCNMNFCGATSCLHVRQSRRGSFPWDQQDRSAALEETSIDRAAMGRLAKALGFICGPAHPTTIALQRAAESGTERDIKQARVLFMRLKLSDRKAALAMLAD